MATKATTADLNTSTAKTTEVKEAPAKTTAEEVAVNKEANKKETAETEYWLRLLTLSQYLTAAESQSLLTDCLELKRILIAILKTSKSTSEPPAT